ncbi:hypothetical protein ACFTWS_10465 [Streptomyces sp. NPDC057027]|uniref:hypothetical protein n=1 Tax=Streptomyces sp. NPDC057027 TaxID=3346004 RepID=UPI00362FBAFD
MSGHEGAARRRREGSAGSPAGGRGTIRYESAARSRRTAAAYGRRTAAARNRRGVGS